MKKPTLTEVTAYFISVGSTEYLARLFFQRYQANKWTALKRPTAETNWQATRRPLKKWQSAVPPFVKRNTNGQVVPTRYR